MSCYEDVEEEKYEECEMCCNDWCKYCYKLASHEKPTNFIPIEAMILHEMNLYCND